MNITEYDQVVSQINPPPQFNLFGNIFDDEWSDHDGTILKGLKQTVITTINHSYINDFNSLKSFIDVLKTTSHTPLLDFCPTSSVCYYSNFTVTPEDIGLFQGYKVPCINLDQHGDITVTKPDSWQSYVEAILKLHAIQPIRVVRLGFGFHNCLEIFSDSDLNKLENAGITVNSKKEQEIVNFI